ncbi:unnamed protein product [Sphenostylis stenocarpa]|uniref:Uncharacterized protein n=1 Tax=Sphenostylis stenocarpa TaxID=92480 RepID=A0AA86T5V6_9FABA|nr:unnamed protein product [Sphenostylis stenocarpa]
MSVVTLSCWQSVVAERVLASETYICMCQERFKENGNDEEDQSHTCAAENGHSLVSFFHLNSCEVHIVSE